VHWRAESALDAPGSAGAIAEDVSLDAGRSPLVDEGLHGRNGRRWGDERLGAWS